MSGDRWRGEYGAHRLRGSAVARGAKGYRRPAEQLVNCDAAPRECAVWSMAVRNPWIIGRPLTHEANQDRKGHWPVLWTPVRPTGGGGASSLSAANNDDSPSCRANTNGSACQ